MMLIGGQWYQIVFIITPMITVEPINAYKSIILMNHATQNPI